MRTTLTLVIINICLVIGVRCEENERIVDTKNGLVRGPREVTHEKSVAFYAFRGIPYAKPPLGDLRFKAPEPADSWTPVTLDASQHRSSCTQPYDLGYDPSAHGEDCLYLNIFVPADTQPNEKMAVIFFIHGIAYAAGTGNEFINGPDFFVESGVILVTLDYRLGALGFLSLNLPEYSGNMGLKDQQLALKWTHENIEYFGGDNARVTILGDSSGASSAHLQLLSAESRKYFHNVILRSGSALHHWAMSSLQTHTDLAFILANHWKQPQESLTDLIDLFKSVPAKRFHSISEVGFETTLSFVFAPVIERMFIGQALTGSDAVRPFLTKSPEELYDSDEIDKDALFGVTSHECHDLCHVDEELDGNLNVILPFNGIDLSFSSSTYQQIRAQLRDFYFKNMSDFDIDYNDYMPLLSDINFVYDAMRAVKTHALKSKGKGFFYHFGVESTHFTESYNSGHGDDWCYVFRCNYAEELYSDCGNHGHSKIDFGIAHQMMELFTSFAKYGKPTFNGEFSPTELPPIESDRVPYVDITNKGLEIKDKFREETFDFWTAIERRVRG